MVGQGCLADLAVRLFHVGSGRAVGLGGQGVAGRVARRRGVNSWVQAVSQGQARRQVQGDPAGGGGDPGRDG